MGVSRERDELTDACAALPRRPQLHHASQITHFGSTAGQVGAAIESEEKRCRLAFQALTRALEEVARRVGLAGPEPEVGAGVD